MVQLYLFQDLLQLHQLIEIRHSVQVITDAIAIHPVGSSDP